LGQLSFYVEALDRDVKKPHERTFLPPKEVLRAKLQEFYAQLAPEISS